MLDIKFIRENPEKVKEAMQKRGVRVDVDELLSLDEKRRGILRQIEKLRETQNTFLKKEKEEEKKIKPANRSFHPVKDKPSDEYIQKAREIKTRVKELEP